MPDALIAGARRGLGSTFLSNDCEETNRLQSPGLPSEMPGAPVTKLNLTDWVFSDHAAHAHSEVLPHPLTRMRSDSETVRRPSPGFCKVEPRTMVLDNIIGESFFYPWHLGGKLRCPSPCCWEHSKLKQPPQPVRMFGVHRPL